MTHEREVRATVSTGSTSVLIVEQSHEFPATCSEQPGEPAGPISREGLKRRMGLNRVPSVDLGACRADKRAVVILKPRRDAVTSARATIRLALQFLAAERTPQAPNPTQVAGCLLPGKSRHEGHLRVSDQSYKRISRKLPNERECTELSRSGSQGNEIGAEPSTDAQCPGFTNCASGSMTRTIRSIDPGRRPYAGPRHNTLPVTMVSTTRPSRSTSRPPGRGVPKISCCQIGLPDSRSNATAYHCGCERYFC